MTILYVAPQVVADEFMRAARRFLLQSEAEFAGGDLIQASEKGWGAAAESVKAAATLRGIPHRHHRELRQVADDIAEETGNPRISELFTLMDGLHANFYEAWMRPNVVRIHLNGVHELVNLLESAPPPAGLRVRPIRARQFIRDKDDWVE